MFSSLKQFRLIKLLPVLKILVITLYLINEFIAIQFFKNFFVLCCTLLIFIIVFSENVTKLILEL